MQFFTIGRASDYAARTIMLKKAQDKMNGVDTQSASYTQDIEKAKKNAERQSRIEAIKNKLECGAKLSTKDLEYLRKEAPQLYQKVMRIQQEREQYAKELRKCKTKEEVARLNMAHMNRVMSELKVAEKSGSEEDILVAKWKMLAFQNETSTFVSTKEYRDLPSETEKAKEKKDRKKAKNNEDKKDNGYVAKLLKTNRNENVIKGSVEEAYQRYLANMENAEAAKNEKTATGGFGNDDYAEFAEYGDFDTAEYDPTSSGDTVGFSDVKPDIPQTESFSATSSANAKPKLSAKA